MLASEVNQRKGSIQLSGSALKDTKEKSRNERCKDQFHTMNPGHAQTMENPKIPQNQVSKQVKKNKKIMVFRTINETTVIQDRTQNKKALKTLKDIMRLKNKNEIIQKDEVWKKEIIQTPAKELNLIDKNYAESEQSSFDCYYEAKKKKKRQRRNSVEQDLYDYMKQAMSLMQNKDLHDIEFKNLPKSCSFFNDFYLNVSHDFVQEDNAIK